MECVPPPATDTGDTFLPGRERLRKRACGRTSAHGTAPASARARGHGPQRDAAGGAGDSVLPARSFCQSGSRPSRPRRCCGRGSRAALSPPLSPHARPRPGRGSRPRSRCPCSSAGRGSAPAEAPESRPITTLPPADPAPAAVTVRGPRAPESPTRRRQLLPSPRQRRRSGLCPEPRALSGRPGRRTLSGRLSDCFEKFEMLRELPKCGEEARRSTRRVPDAEGPRRSAARGAGGRSRIGSGRVSITASGVGTKRDALPS